MSLANLLSQQQQHLDTLATLLVREQDLLVEGRVDGEHLAELVRHKQLELAAIDTLERRRQGAQAQLGYAAGTPGAEQAARDAGCMPQWQRLQDTARRITHLNRLNGGLIERRLQHNQQVLTLLRELVRDALYGDNGQQGLGGGRIHSSA